MARSRATWASRASSTGTASPTPRSSARRSSPPTTTTGTNSTASGTRGCLWAQAERHPERLEAVIDKLIKNGTNWDPTLAVYEDNRDVWRAVGLPIKQTLMHPSEIEAGPDTERARRLQARVEDERRDQLEEELPDLDEVREDVPRARRPAHGRERRGRDRRHRLDPRARAHAGDGHPPARRDQGRDHERLHRCSASRTCAASASAAAPTSPW